MTIRKKRPRDFSPAAKLVAVARADGPTVFQHRAASARPRSSSRFIARVLPGAKPAPFPDFIEPCLATLRSTVPSARGFVHELKLDGYRVQAHLHDGRVSLYTRTGLDWTTRFPTIAADVARLPAGKLVIDGEVISADATGRPNFRPD